MNDKLRRCAENGDVDALYSILAQDPDALERLDRMQFVDTPLHIAASAGNPRFAMEIATLKPSFARKLNQLGLSPMHLALQNGHHVVVKWMLQKVGAELVRVKGKGSITPLHYVAQTGNVDMLVLFLRFCPSSIEDLTAELETAVHVAVKNSRLNVFKELLKWLRLVHKKYVLEWQDGNGNTALHIATSTSQFEVMQLLIENVNVNDKNIFDLFDLQRYSLDTEAGSILARAKARKASIASRAYYMIREVVKLLGIVGEHEASIDVRNVVLVVAVLIATATYQAAVSPPGGYWQEANDNPHLAGKMILNTNCYFFVLNSIAFFTAECTILLVITGLPFSGVLYLSTYFLLLSYATALFLTFPPGVGPSILKHLGLVVSLITFAIPFMSWTKHTVRKRWLSGVDKNILSNPNP